MTHAFRIDRGTLGLMTGAGLLVTAALTPFVGQATDRYGVRRLVLPGVAALAVVQMLLALVPVSTPLLTVLLLLRGAAGALLMPLASPAVSQTLAVAGAAPASEIAKIDRRAPTAHEHRD